MLHRNNNYTVANLVTISNLYWKLQTIIEITKFDIFSQNVLHDGILLSVYIIMKSEK